MSTNSSNTNTILETTLSNTYKKKLFNKDPPLGFRKTKKINKKINKIELINILYNSNDFKEIVEKLKNFYKNNIDNDKFLKYEKQFIPFDKNMQGRSGSIVGYLKDKPKSVLKIYYLKNNIDVKKLIYYDNCIELNNKFNEIFMNLLFKYIKYLPNISEIEIKKVKKHILEIEDYGFGNDSYYIVMPLVGIKYIDINITNQKTYFMTNLTNIMKINHTPFLKKAFNENNSKILKLYDEFMYNSLSSLFKALKILQKKINYINSDCKFDNIFLKSHKNTTSKFNELREYGFVIDYILLLSDLEKSNITINNNKFISYYGQKIPYFISGLGGYKLIRDVRHLCDLKMEKLCPKLIINDFDILCIIIQLYINFLNININFLNYIPKINELHKEFLSINHTDYQKLVNILIKGKYNLEKYLPFKLSRILTKLC